MLGEQDNSLPSGGFPFESLTAKSAASGAANSGNPEGEAGYRRIA